MFTHNLVKQQCRPSPDPYLECILQGWAQWLRLSCRLEALCSTDPLRLDPDILPVAV